MFIKIFIKIANTKLIAICLITTILTAACGITCFADSSSVCVPILMYHAVSNEADNPYAIAPDLFEQHISGLLQNGYTPVFLSQLYNYVESGKELPSKPICLTFDDGYLSNYDTAFPILKKYNAKGTIFVIGVSVGKNTYKDTTYSMSPHFGYNEAREMQKSGLVDIQSHTYDMHQWAPYEGRTETARENILRLDGESVMDYILQLRYDIGTSQKKIKGELGTNVYAVAYPSGRYDNITEMTLHDMGINVTLATTMGNNYVEKGKKDTLYKMNRYNMNSEVTLDILLDMIK